MKNIRVIICSLVAIVSISAYSDCQEKFHKYQRKVSTRQDAEKAAAIAAGAASFLGPLGLLCASALGASAVAALHREENILWVKYQDCLKSEEEERVRLMYEAGSEAEKERFRKENEEKQRLKKELQAMMMNAMPDLRNMRIDFRF